MKNMDLFKIEGGSPLFGEVAVSGAKNAALPILCASLLTAETVEVGNVPFLCDVETILKLLARMGVRVQRDGHRVVLNAGVTNSVEASSDLVRTMRAAVLVLGPLVARFGEARVALPGGCAIGQRPVDQHLKGLRAMGADIVVEHGHIVARAPRLKGALIVMDVVTVTGTENLMMAATLADGVVVIENAAREPEIVDLANALLSMGARIEGAGTDRIVVEGVCALRGVSHSVMADRIEAGTFLCAAAVTSGSIALSRIDPSIMVATLRKLEEAGAEIRLGRSDVYFSMKGRPQAVNLRTAPYPAFATDMQAQFMAMNCVAAGSGVIAETIFENRFMHVRELQRLGADISVNGNLAVVQGVPRLFGASVEATDLRASASLVIAALAAEGRTDISCIHHLDRGYEVMEQKLSALGACVERVSAPFQHRAQPAPAAGISAELCPAA